MDQVILILEKDSGETCTVDLYGTEKIAMNYAFTDPAEFAVVGSGSWTFRIPATETNLSFFGDLSNVNFTGDFSFHKKVKGTLTVDTIPVATGHSQVLKAYKIDNQYSELEIVFFAESPDLVREVGSKMLSELDYTDLEHTMTMANVLAGGTGYKYALIDRGYKFSEQGEVGTRPIVSTASPVYPTEMTMMVQESWLFDKIIREAGFTYTTDNILPEMEAVHVPFCNSKWNKATTLPAQYLFSAYLTSNLSVGALVESDVAGMTETLDANGDLNATTGVYTAPFTGWFTFRLWATNDPTATSGIVANYRTIRLRQNGATVYTQMTTPTAATATKNLQSNDVTLFLTAGDLVKMTVQNQAAGTFLGGTTDFANGTGWALVNTSDALAGLTIDVAANAPKVTQIDFMRDVLKKYNMVMVPDRNIPKLIHFEPFADYIGGGNTLDWTSKLDYGKDQVIAPTTEYQAKVLTFTYTKGNDAASELFNKEGKRVYGDYRVEGYTVNPTDHPNDFASGDRSVQLVAQSTPCNTIAGTSNVIPKFVDASGEFTDPGLRFLYVVEDACYIALYNDVTEAGELVTVNTANHYSVINANIGDKDLNFAPETPLQLITANPYDNLFNRYWRPYLNELYSPSARRLTCYMNLDINDIVSFGFDDRIWIVDSWWRLLSISNYEVGSSEPVECEFMRLLDAQLDCDSTPYQITIAGIVQFQSPDESIGFGTENCCNRYGYEWNSEQSKCYAFNAGGPDRPSGVTTEVTGGNFGLSFENSGATRYTGQMTNRSIVSPDTMFSYLAGSDIQVGDGNPHSMIGGEHIIVDPNLRGVAAFGKNTKVFSPGLHLGGGWFGDDRGNADGQSQFGVIPFIGEGNFTNNASQIPITIEGIAGKHLIVDDKTVLACELCVSVMKYDPAGGTIDDTRTLKFAFTAYKVAGESKKSTVHTVFDFGGMHTMNLNIDTTTNTDEHRLSLSMGGSGHPHNNIKIAAHLTYTQVKE